VLTDVNLAPGAPTQFIDSFDPAINDAFFTLGWYLGWTGGTSTDLGVASNWDDFTDGQDPSLIVPGPGEVSPAALARRLAVTGVIITGDAMFTQREICRVIIEWGGAPNPRATRRREQRRPRLIDSL
jgi:hypothetical protein